MSLLVSLCLQHWQVEDVSVQESYEQSAVVICAVLRADQQLLRKEVQDWMDLAVLWNHRGLRIPCSNDNYSTTNCSITIPTQVPFKPIIN